MFRTNLSGGEEGPRRRRLLPVFGAVLTGLALLAVSLTSGAAKTEAAGAGSGISQTPTVMNDSFYDDCSPFTTFGTYYDPYGSPYYQPLPIYGNPLTVYNQCINYANTYGYNSYNNCGPNSFSYYYGCMNFCATATQQLYASGLQVCAGPPASILISPSPTSVSCASSSNIEVVVLDANGLRVTDGTSVNFTTTMGYISSTDGTTRGIAYTSLTIPSKQSGQVVVTASSGGATAQKLIQVTC